jgi:hypothetical protein
MPSLCGHEHPLKPGVLCDQPYEPEHDPHQKGDGLDRIYWPNRTLGLTYNGVPPTTQGKNEWLNGAARDAKPADRAPPPAPPPRLRFDGATYVPEFDERRLGIQHRAVWQVVRDENWRTLEEIIASIVAQGGREYATAAISARVRDFRKPRFGGFIVDIRARGDRHNGLFEYRVRRPAATQGRISEG